MNRSEQIKMIRPSLDLEQHEDTSKEERFQNDVLRPILKLQNELLHSLFSHERERRKHKIDVSSPKTIRMDVDRILKQDHKIQERLVYSIVGLFSIEELTTYHAQQRELHKRIVSMMSKRLSSHLIEDS